MQIESNIFFPCFLMKYYGIDYDQSCVIINCLHMMDFCTHDISLKFPFITNKGKKMLDLDKNNYFFERYNTFINQVIVKEKKIEDNILKNKNFFDSQWGAHFLTGYEIFMNNFCELHVSSIF